VDGKQDHKDLTTLHRLQAPTKQEKAPRLQGKKEETRRQQYSDDGEHH
jgi:hypothetical protein